MGAIGPTVPIPFTPISIFPLKGEEDLVVVGRVTLESPKRGHAAYSTAWNSTSSARMTPVASVSPPTNSIENSRSSNFRCM